MASRNLDLLHPTLRPIALKFIDACKAANINMVICCTYRSDDEQNSLYAYGRTRAGKRVTNAKAGESAHNVVDKNGGGASCAFDIACFMGGKYAPDTDNQWARAGKIGTDLGLDWLGSPDSTFFELAHFQLKDWRKYK
ncbi:MAG: M15 family metallopeptidase [Burkholderiales bacterium]|nr:M15 family metallopeptidase [Burkholderiales bacterium]